MSTRPRVFRFLALRAPLCLALLLFTGSVVDWNTKEACAQAEMCGSELSDDLTRLGEFVVQLRDSTDDNTERRRLERQQTIELSDWIDDFVYLEGNPETEVYSLEGSYCGAAPATTGAVGSVTAAKALCETQCSSSIAHVCSAIELVRYLSTGGTVSGGEQWVSSAAQGAATLGGNVLNNCAQWTSADGAADAGTTILGSSFSSRSCDAVLPIACCL